MQTFAGIVWYDRGILNTSFGPRPHRRETGRGFLLGVLTGDALGFDGMAATLITVVCAECGSAAEKPLGEVKRSLRLGRRLFCSRTCSAKASNKLRKAQTVTMDCPTCGTGFESTTRNRAKRYCSRSCASRGSVTPKRRSAQKRAGREHAANLKVAAALKSRECWKYSALSDYLGDRAHEFEFELMGRVFDLALFDTKVLVEFDGPDHRSEETKKNDSKKEQLAKKWGWIVKRRTVRPSTAIDPVTLVGL